jgi:hypothetical protein
MKDKEIIEFLKQNEENTYQLEISANIMTIINILTANKLITLNKYNELKQQSLEAIRKEQVNRMTKEEKDQIETLKSFNDLFGGFFNK